MLSEPASRVTSNQIRVASLNEAALGNGDLAMNLWDAFDMRRGAAMPRRATFRKADQRRPRALRPLGVARPPLRAHGRVAKWLKRTTR